MMFGKKKTPEGTNYSVSDERVPTTLIRRFPEESVRTSEYSVYPQFRSEAMIPLIDGYLEKLLEGKIDSGNGDTLDSIIFGMYSLAVSDTKIQRSNHKDTNRRIFAKRDSGRKSIEGLIRSTDEELEELEEIHNETKKLIARYKGTEPKEEKEVPNNTKEDNYYAE